jgi:hypothetical protein
MQYLRKESLAITAIALILAVVSWGIGFRLFMPKAQASLASVTDILSNSIPSYAATHVIQYTNASATTAGQTIDVTFDPTTSLFGNIAAITAANATTTGSTGSMINIVSGACPGSGNNVTVSSTATDVILHVCPSNTVASGTLILTLSNTITNPTSTGSYIIRIADGPNSADTRVAIVNTVAMTASVDTTFTFTVAGLATSTSIGFATTTGTASSTALAFGTLTPGSSSAKILGQELAVTTNARNGYTVTVQQDQNMYSANGATINVFRDNNATSTPSVWVSPAGTLDATNTYAHYGFTSDSQEEGSGEFNSSTNQLYVGNISTPRAIMSHPNTCDGTTQSKCRVQVGVKIEITPLEPAGNDYHNTLWYVATPSF